MQQYDLISLRSFITVVDTGSFNQAALRLNASTAAVSRRISSLESTLGVRLLNRTTRKIDLTDSGKQFYSDIINVFQSLEEAEERIQQGSKAIKGTLRIAAGLSWGTICFSTMLPKFMKKHPELDVQLHLDDKTTDLVAESIDVALRIGELQDSSLVASRIADVPVQYCASPGYIKKYGEPKQPEDLIHHNCLRYNAPSTRFGFVFSRDGTQQHIDVRGTLSTNNGEIIRDAAINGIGITLLPDFVYQDAIKDGRLEIILAEFAPSPLGLYAVKLSRQFTPAKVNALIDFLKEELTTNNKK